MRFNLMITAVLAVFLSVLTSCQSSASTVKTEPAKSNSVSTSVPKTDEHGHLDEAPRISLDDAKKDFDAGNVIFVDTRAEVQYKQEHIKGAINVPAEAMETRYKEIPTDKKIIAYCS